MRIATALVFTVFLSGCMADLSTKLIKNEGITEASEEKGRALLDAAWKAQGMDQLSQFQTYETKLEDHWKGLAGSLARLWPEKRTDFQIRYAIGTFDGELEFLSGNETGHKAGLQSWHYYEQAPGEEVRFLDEPNMDYRFGLAAFQYFFELTDRLRNAPIIGYAGKREFNGNTYDQVFVTWEKLEPHIEHDQYVVWINRQTGLAEMCEFTLRDASTKLPGSKAVYGSIRFKDLRSIDGILIPFEQFIFIQSPKKKDKSYIHKLTLSSFAFDAFDIAYLYKDPSIEPLGDEKVE